MRMGKVVISRVDKNWASVEETSYRPRAYYLFHRGSHGWDVAYVFDAFKKNADELSERSPYGGCAYAPARVIRDLFRIECPSGKGLHARTATKAEMANMRIVFLTTLGKLSPTEASSVHLSACVSRLDPDWARAGVFYGGPNSDEMSASAGPTLYFRRKGATWQIDNRPSHAIALSFTICNPSGFV